MDATELLGEFKLIPVVVLEDAGDAVPLAEALLAGGIGVMEVTLRTAGGLEAIARVAQHVPKMIVGAGSVRTPQHFADVVSAGGRFRGESGGLPFAVQRGRGTWARFRARGGYRVGDARTVGTRLPAAKVFSGRGKRWHRVLTVSVGPTSRSPIHADRRRECSKRGTISRAAERIWGGRLLAHSLGTHCERRFHWNHGARRGVHARVRLVWRNDKSSPSYRRYRGHQREVCAGETRCRWFREGNDPAVRRLSQRRWKPYGTTWRRCPSQSRPRSAWRRRGRS